MAGAGGWLTAHQQTKYQELLPSLFTHPLASSIQKKSLLGSGGVFLSRGKWEFKAPVQGEAAVHQEAVVGTSRVKGNAMRGDLQPARANKRATQQETTQQPDSVGEM